MSTCRGCLVKEADVYQSLFSHIEMIQVKHMFHLLTGLIVHREDGLPRYICQQCCEALLHFYKLRAKMIESDAFLRKSLVPAGPALNECEGSKDENRIDIGDATPTMQGIDMLVKSENQNEQITEEELDGDESIPLTGTLQTITELIQIERLSHEDTSSMQSSSQLGEVYKIVDEGDFGDYEDENGTEYLTSDLEVEEESELSANDAESKKDIPDDSLVHCCSCAHLRFSNREELAQHTQDEHAKYRVSNNVRPYECDVCYKRFSHYNSLQKHQTMPYREKKYACREPNCDARFFGRSALLSHKRSKHLRVRSYLCDLCEKSFYTSSTLLCHRQIHTEKQYQCQTCKKMFLRKGDLLTHQTAHLDERPFVCPECDKRFKSRNHLRNHQYIHSSKPRLKCDICGATFSTYNDRRVHLLGHQNVDPYKCTHCDKVFKRNYKLQVHIRKVHTGERPYGCTRCPETFFQNWELTAHLRKEHGMTETNEPASRTKQEESFEQLKEV